MNNFERWWNSITKPPAKHPLQVTHERYQHDMEMAKMGWDACEELIKKQADKLLEEFHQKRDKERSPWIDVILNPENWEKLDIRVQQKSGQFKRLRKPK